MKQIRLLTTMLFFSGLLAGCGMKGPLYRAPVKPTATSVTVDKKEISQESTPVVEEKTEQDNLDNSTK
ncbi:MAG: putative small lipoprotein YifL [Psychromonas sp.]|jgi:predicted small lipoprotein YifL|uniref:LPS translocon maturation chaperone LptM n=1 Tax=Psychromonas sp. TaxID=1884585 RepID=UPI0039E36787